MIDSEPPTRTAAADEAAPSETGATDSIEGDRLPTSRSTSWLQQLLVEKGLTRLDTAIAVIVGIFSIAWAPIFITGAVPRLSIAYGLAPLGIGLIVVAAFNGDRAALAAIGACASFVIAGVFAEAPRASFVGKLPEWSSVLALVASIAWWGLGRSLSAPGMLLLARVLAAGGLLNGMVALAQLAVGSKAGEMFVVAERGAGLMANPVFFGTFMIGVAGLWLAMTSQRSSHPRLVLCSVLMFFAALSGGRVVLGAAAFVLVACLFACKRAAFWPVGVGLIGFAIGDRTLSLLSADVSSVDRLAGGESIASRLKIWRFGLDAVAHRPLFGWGPANAELAINRRIDRAFVQDQWPEGNVQVWWDPHNFLVFALVSVGLVGTAAIGLLVASSLRGDRHWPALLAILAMCATWMLQPFTVHTLPVAMLLLGAVARPRDLRINDATSDLIGAEVDEPRADPNSFARWQKVAMGVGVAITTALLSGAFLVERWSLSNRPDDAARAATVFGGDPWLDSYISNAYLRTFSSGVDSGIGDPTLLDEAVRYSRRSSEVYPTSEQLQDLADLSVTLGDLDTAVDALQRAVELHPWDPTALLRLHWISVQLEDDEFADLTKGRLCQLNDFWCSQISEQDAGDENP